MSALDYDDTLNYKLDEDSPNVKLKRIPRNQNNNFNSSRHNDEASEQGGNAGPFSPASSSGYKRGGGGGAHVSFGSPTGAARSPGKKGATAQPSAGDVDPANPSTYHYYTSSEAIDWTEVLTNFYTVLELPGKINGIPTILKKWQAKEEEMLLQLMEKYSKEIPKKLNNYLQHIILLLETKTDSSFRQPSKPAPLNRRRG